MATNYWDYIRVGDLLRLQEGIEGDEARLADDEVVFIVVHQVYELWFKLVLRQLGSARDALAQDVVPEESIATVCSGLDRCVRILRVAVQHFEVVESIQTRDYLAFRDKLFPASGFQSAQLREIEILLGLPADERIPFGSDRDAWLDALKDHHGQRGEGWERVQARLADRPSLREALEAWLARTPIRGSSPGDAGDDEVVAGFLADYRAAHEVAVRRLVASIGETAGVPPAALEAR
ncbi:MAG: tryptophan 2,3-dioxygenase, partial [Planctomycetes bacterium]|nr:tryptophan 2,3-dioxygenase [Planctomycetota bacterium]